jgi:sulfur transfer protein SufE
MTLADKQRELTAARTRIPNAQERFARVIEIGRGKPGLAPEEKTGNRRVEGCLARLACLPLRIRVAR